MSELNKFLISPIFKMCCIILAFFPEYTNRYANK